jgi:integrase/recombinase XerD
MTPLAPHLTKFLREHLPRERRASGHTCDAYAYSFQLLVTFAAGRLRKRPCLLQIQDLDVPMILAFLEHIEQDRGNTARSRNARLAAVKSFFRYLEHCEPTVLDQALRVHAIPMKKVDEALVSALTRPEVQTLLDVPDRRTASGIRDRAMLHLAFAGGLRVSELVGLDIGQFDGRPRPASMSWAKAGANGCCRFGRRRQPPFVPGLPSGPSVATPRCS